MSKTDYYSEAAHGPHEIFELGNYLLESGITLPNARIAYKTHGTLNAAKDNVVLFPHMWSGTPKAMEIFIGEDRPLNPRKYFIMPVAEPAAFIGYRTAATATASHRFRTRCPSR
jgi:homoserine O-acetyltransferase/O-succinyltransferase